MTGGDLDASGRRGLRGSLTRRLRSGPAQLLIGKIALIVSQGLILLVFARLEGAATVGRYTLALAIVSPVFLMAHLRMQDVMASHPRVGDVWAAHVRILVITSSVALGLTALIAVAWPSLDLWQFVLPVAAAKWIESLVFTAHGYWQSQGAYGRVATSTIVRSVAACLSVGVGTWLVGAVFGLALMAAVSALLILVIERPAVPSVFGPYGEEPWFRLAFSLAPLGVVAMLLSLNQHVVRVVIGAHVGTAALGVFAVTAYLVRTGTIVARAIGQGDAHTLRAARIAGNRDTIYRLGLRSTAYGVAFGVAIVAVGLLIGPPFIALLFGPEFRPTRLLIGLVLAAGVPLYGTTALSMYTVALGQHRKYVAVVCVSLAVTAAAAAVLTPLHGLNGAAVGWLVGETVKLLLMVALLRWSVTRESADE